MQPCRAMWLAIVPLVLAGCGGSAPADQPADRNEPAPRRETVFDPLTSTIDRAQGVQQTVDEQAAEQRRRLEEAER
jgi:hypothetical protein